MAMRSSSQQDRDQGYGLPPTEFTDLHIARVGWSLSGTVVASPRMIGARTRPAICSSWLIQPLLQVAQTALTVVWNGLLVWRYSLDRFSHPDPAAAGWPVRTMRSSQSGSTCSLVIVPLAPQKTQAVAMPGSLHHRDPSYARARSSGSRARPTRPTTVLGGRVRVAQGSTVPFRRIPFIPVLSCRKSSSLTPGSFHVSGSHTRLYAQSYETESALNRPGPAPCFIGEHLANATPPPDRAGRPGRAVPGPLGRPGGAGAGHARRCQGGRVAAKGAHRSPGRPGRPARPAPSAGTRRVAVRTP